MERRTFTEENPLNKNLLPGREAREFARAVKPAQLHLDEKGREVLDGTPIAPPIGFKETVPLAMQIREMVRSEHLRLAAEKSGLETFEEADDFDIDDPDGTAYDPSSPYEIVFEGIPAEPPQTPAVPETGGGAGKVSEPEAPPPTPTENKSS